MEYKSTSYFSKKWNISERRIRFLCSLNRIEGAIKIGKTWLIPIDANKPSDERFKDKFELFFDVFDFQIIDQKKDLIESFRPFNSEVIKQLKEKLVVEWTYNSNAIEGNTLTLSETKVLLENGITVDGKPLKDHLETINHKEAINFIEELVSNNSQLTESNIKSIHYLILKNIDSNNAGKYRERNVFISGARHVPPSFLTVPLEMQKLIVNYKKWKNLHPIVRACFLHGEFVKIHPFIDGNGRTARILLNFELMRCGYPPIVIKNKNRVEYYDALDKAHTTNDYTDFIHMVTQLVEEAEDNYLFLLNS